MKGGGEAPLHKESALSPRKLLVVCQIAASLTLLLLTAFMGMGIQSSMSVQEGFNPKNLHLLALDPVRDGVPAAETPRLFTQLLERVRSLPGVAAACLTDTLPVSVDGNPGVQFANTGARAAGAAETLWARKHVVGSGYFETAGIRVLAGRGFDKRDEEGRTEAVVVSQEAVRRFWKDRNPLGQRIEIRNLGASGGVGIWPGTFDNRGNMVGEGMRTVEVAGIVADVSEDLIASKKHPALYFPLRAGDYAQPSLRGMTLMMRGVPGADVIRDARGAIEAFDARIAPFNARSMEQHIDQYMSALKGASWTYGLMGVFGLVLAAVGGGRDGVFGIEAYARDRYPHGVGRAEAQRAGAGHEGGSVDGGVRHTARPGGGMGRNSRAFEHVLHGGQRAKLRPRTARRRPASARGTRAAGVLPSGAALHADRSRGDATSGMRPADAPMAQ